MNCLIYRRKDNSISYIANPQKYLSFILAPYAAGIFETILVINGKPVFLEKHIERLFNSADFFSTPLPHKKILYEIIAKKASKIPKGKSALRLSVYLYEEDFSIIFIMSRKYPYSEEIIFKGRKVCFSKWKRDPKNPLYRHKTTNQFENKIALNNAIKMGYDDCIFINIDGNITEATSSNVFVVSKGIVKTPPGSDGILKGITRNIVIDLIKSELNGVELIEDSISPKELAEFDEVFLTNSLFGVMPVSNIENKKIFDQVPGEITVKVFKLIWEYFYKDIEKI